jgi:hypothetical protein
VTICPPRFNISAFFPLILESSLGSHKALISEMAAPHRKGTALTRARRDALFTSVGIASEDDLDALIRRMAATLDSMIDSTGAVFGSQADRDHPIALSKGERPSVTPRSRSGRWGRVTLILKRTTPYRAIKQGSLTAMIVALAWQRFLKNVGGPYCAGAGAGARGGMLKVGTVALDGTKIAHACGSGQASTRIALLL